MLDFFTLLKKKNNILKIPEKLKGLSLDSRIKTGGRY